MKIYFWAKMTRVTGQAPKDHRWYASCGTDAETTGRFCESVEWADYAIYKSECHKRIVADAFIADVHRHAKDNGFNTKPWVIEIQEKEYRYYERRRNAWAKGELV